MKAFGGWVAITITIAAALSINPARSDDASICKGLLDAYQSDAQALVLKNGVWVSHVSSATDHQLEKIDIDAQINALLMAQLGNLILMQSRKCPMPDMPMSTDPNPKKAGACGLALAKARLAIMKGATADTSLPEACK